MLSFNPIGQIAQPDLTYDVERRPSGLPTRNRRLPQRYRDDPPPIPIPVPVEEPSSHVESDEDPIDTASNFPMDIDHSDTDSIPASFRTPPDTSNMF